MKTFWLFAAASLIFLLSLFLMPVSVHTYCENRPIAGVFGVIAVAIGILFLRHRSLRGLLRGLGIVICSVAVALNLAFIAYATHLCNHMFDQLI
jgi:hypothetical protein